MLAKVVTALKGAAALLVIGLSTIVLSLVISILALPRLVAPTDKARAKIRHWVASLVELWTGINNLVLSMYRNTRWDIQVPENLDYQGCYVVSSNHQSWVDIILLQRY